MDKTDFKAVIDSIRKAWDDYEEAVSRAGKARKEAIDRAWKTYEAAMAKAKEEG